MTIGIWRGACIAAVAMACSLPADASTYVTNSFTCPVGGERFSAQVLASNSTFGMLPDGMPIGSAEEPILPVICPGNGLPMYREFTATEIMQLEPFLQSRQWTQLRREDVPHYRIWHIAVLLGDDDALWHLLAATWAAKQDGANPVRTIRYQETFVAAVLQMPSYRTRADIILMARAANALRELGRFAEARALIERFPATLEQLSTAPVTAEDEEEESRAEFHTNVLAFGRDLMVAINRSDSQRIPLDMVDERQAAWECQHRLSESASRPMSAFDQEFCARPEIVELLG